MTDWRCPDCGRAFANRNASHSCNSQTPEELLRGYPEFLPLYEQVRRLLGSFGAIEVEATRTQIAFRAARRFAYLWVPALSLKRGPVELFLSFDLDRRLGSKRIREAVQARPGLWVHHLRIVRTQDVDAEVQGWLRDAFELASRPRRRTRPRTAPGR